MAPSAQYKYPIGTKVWVIVDPKRAQKKCDHCGEWTEWKPLYKAEEVEVQQANIWVDKNGVSASYQFVGPYGGYSEKSEKEIYATQAEAEQRIGELNAEWEKRRSS